MKQAKSIAVVSLIAIIYALSIYAYKPYHTASLSLAQSTYSYYLYLPSFFIYHDMYSLQTTRVACFFHSHSQSAMSAVGSIPAYVASPSAIGIPVINNTMGVAVLEFPFFMGAHLGSKLLHLSADGFSTIYMHAIQCASLFYLLLGLLLLSSILRQFFSATITALLLFFLGLGTNLYFVSALYSPIAPPFLFFLYTLLLYATLLYYRRHSWWYIIPIGISLGLIVLVQPFQIYAVLIPLLWGIKDIASAKERFKQLVPICFALLIALLCFSPQLLYWHRATGHYWYHQTSDIFFRQHSIQLYPLLCFPLGYILRQLWKSRLSQIIIIASIVLLCLCNLAFTYMYWYHLLANL